jgi:glycosyltransferase involved in cell wall biosynthesis
MRVALVHDWLVAHRGGEAVLLQLSKMFPDAPIYTLAADQSLMHPLLATKTIHTSFIQNLPGAPAQFRQYLPLFPRAIESFDFSGFDLVISTSHCVAKGIVTGSIRHVSYVHTPMRYIWDQRAHYYPAGILGAVARPAYEGMAALLRVWDKRSSSRPTQLIANSDYVAQRIQRCWGRGAEVIYPPVDTEFYTPGTEQRENSLVVVGAQVGYKNTSLAVEAATIHGFSLKVVGAGPAIERLKSMAGPTVEFQGQITNEALRSIYRQAKGLLFCGVEDFGIVPVEAIACGCPVVARGEGGALETVKVDGPAPMGVHFSEPTVTGLMRAIGALDHLWADNCFEPGKMQAHAATFSSATFRARISDVLGAF